MRFIFLTGVFRSGTTLIGKALDAHPKIAIASDPYFQFFKAFRNEIFHNLKYKEFDDNSPVSDNFFSNSLKANQKIRESNLNIPIKDQDLEKIKENIALYCEYNSPKIVPLLKEAKGETYKELFNSLLNIAKKVYGKPNTKYFGIKNVFAEQFISPIINTYSDCKVINIIRDPRAIVASQNIDIEPHYPKIDEEDGRRYPLLFLIRQWRKSIAYALENIEKKENFLTIKYEDFILNPGKEMKKICSFLELEFDTITIDLEKFRGRKGEKWQSNSAYRELYKKEREISKRPLERWKKILEKKETQFIEDLCHPEFESLGYKRITKENVLETVKTPFPPYKTNIQAWIKKYLKEYEHNEKEMNKEMIRFLLSKNTKILPDVEEKVFLIPNFLEKIKCKI